MIRRVLKAMATCPTELQAERVMEALETIADEMMDADGETHKAMLGCGGAVYWLERAFEQMVDELHGLDMLADFQDLYERIGNMYMEYGHEGIAALAERVQELLTEDTDARTRGKTERRMTRTATRAACTSDDWRLQRV